MTQYHIIGVALLLPLLTGCYGSQTDVATVAPTEDRPVFQVAQEGPSVEEIARNYTSLQLITKEPVLVDPQLASLCVGIWQQHVDNARKRSGPHAHTSIRIYMNAIASTAFRGSGTIYPVGSVIVKEKQGLEYNTKSGSPQPDSRISDGVGGMIKRAPGYDPDHGDWEYFYFEDRLRVEQGKITTCIECHRGAAGSDYVFGSWGDRG